ncbi:hypothetical protein [Prolixibacter sp. NT017]|nr:hypothetical protein [Prolixibacter sp. NT017]
MVKDNASMMPYQLGYYAFLPSEKINLLTAISFDKNGDVKKLSGGGK